LIARDGWSGSAAKDWETKKNSPKSVRTAERPLEQAVSKYIRSMPFLWVGIEDEPGPKSHRGYVEQNAIALLSNYNTMNNPIDPPWSEWLGYWASNKDMHRSGLWNVNHVADAYNPSFLDVLQFYVARM